MPLDAARATELATTIGENALIVFAAALPVLLAIIGVGWFVVHRHYGLLPSAATAF